MLRLKDLMQTDVVAVAPELTLRELVEVLSEHEVSGAPAVAKGRVVGVISTTDIMEFRENTAGITISGEVEAEEGPRRRGSEYFSEAWDGAEAEALEWMKSSQARELDLLDEYTVSDVMTREVIGLPSKTTLKQAAAYMLESAVHRLLVIDGGELRGIVTTTDIVRAVAEGRLKG
jgi:CBS domain-containing protein